MLYSGTDPESYITEYTLVYEYYGFRIRGSGFQGSGVGIGGCSSRALQQ